MTKAPDDVPARMAPFGAGNEEPTLVLHRALQYAATFGYPVWLRPNDAWLGNGVAAKGPLATRLGPPQIGLVEHDREPDRARVRRASGSPRSGGRSA